MDAERLPSMGLVLGAVGSSVPLVAGALAEAKRCHQVLSTVERSSSLPAESIADEMKSLGPSIKVILFVVLISTWTFSITEGQRS